MPAFEPAAYLRFAAEHISLLREIYYRSEGLPEAELRQLIARMRKPEQPASAYIFRQLREMDMVEEMPGQTAYFELTATWEELLGYLFREQRLTNVAVIQTYLNELQKLDRELSRSVQDNDGSQCVIQLQEIRTLVDRLRRDSHDNRLGIIVESLKFKSGEGDITAIERYERIIRLWEKFVEPMRDIIDSRKEMDERLRSLEALMQGGEKVFRLDGIMVREFATMRSRLIRLLRDAMEDYRESVRELEPLYNESLRNSRYLRGATQALDMMSRKGRKSLNLRELLSFPARKSGGAIGLISNDHAEAYFYQISSYSPRAPETIGDAAIDFLPTVVPYSDVRERLEIEQPVDDVLGWLCHNYPDLSPHQLIGLYGRVYGDGFFMLVPGESREYRFDSIVARTYQMRLEVTGG
jgi:hypothetical protein